jgi:hypothetical protein
VQGVYADANYVYPHDDRHSTNNRSDSRPFYGHGSYRPTSGNFRGGARGGFSHGGRGRGGGGANHQRFQRRDRPY